MKKRKANITIFSLLVILALGLFLRVYLLNTIPAGLFCDEASIGYNAYIILTKGTDEFGTHLPLFFRAFGEYKNPIEIYSTVPFISIFGLNDFSVRLPSAIFGVLTIYAIYLLSKELFKKNEGKLFIALFSAFFLAISPWHIQFSRTALEGLTPFVFFTTIGTYFFLKNKGSKKTIILSFLFFIAAIYSYFPARIFVPIFLLGLCILQRKFLFKKIGETLTGIILSLCLLSPLIYSMFLQTGLSRWQQVNIFSNHQPNENIFIHILSNYFSHFSLDFLFLKGGSGLIGQFITRFSVSGMGELYLFQLILIILGLIYLLKIKQKRIIFILIFWLLIYPVGSMFTTDSNVQTTRSIIGVIPFQILSATGLYFLITIFLRLNKNLRFVSTGLVMTLIIFSFVNFLNLYFNHYVSYSSDFWGWQYGSKDIVRYFSTNNLSYNQLVMAPEFNSPEIFFKFYSPNGCSNCIVGLPENYYNSSSKQLFAVKPTYLDGYLANRGNLRFENLHTIYYPNGTIAFVIGKFLQK
jgi:4-amino-4-deoxy-L-arabinose transferase-like glycosyltransferase